MANGVRIIGLLFIGVQMAACGGSNPSTSSTPTNPFAEGELPTEPVTLYTSTAGSIYSKITIDPQKGSYVETGSVSGGNSYIITGSYDASTGVMTQETCDGDYYGLAGNQGCPNFRFEGAQTNLFGGESIGDGLVTVGHFTRYYGVSPTREGQMPKRATPQTYKGGFYSFDMTYPDAEHEELRAVATGNATTSVDFENDKMDTVFTEIQGYYEIDRIEINDMAINGTKFSGGDMIFYRIEAGKDPFQGGASYTLGQFFGKTGEEFGGEFFYSGSSPDLSDNMNVTGAWNGTRQVETEEGAEGGAGDSAEN